MPDLVAIVELRPLQFVPAVCEGWAESDPTTPNRAVMIDSYEPDVASKARY